MTPPGSYHAELQARLDHNEFRCVQTENFVV